MVFSFGNRETSPYQELLKKCKNIAVIGLSADSTRPSHRVAKYLQSKGYRIIPVNPEIDAVLGETSFPDLSSVSVPIDLVNVFRREEELNPLFEETVRLKLPAIWLQPGLHCQDGEARALEQGVVVVTDHCIMSEHRRWF